MKKPEIQIDLKDFDGIPGASIKGDLDLSTTEKVKEACSSLKDFPVVIFEMTEVSYADSTTIKWILSECRTKNRIIILAISPFIERLLNVIGLHDYIGLRNHYESIDLAIARAKKEMAKAASTGN